MPSPATRTLILGIDLAGRILQCDRHAPKVLGRSPGELLGAELGDLTSGTAEQKDALAGLINAMRSGRESTTMLCLETEKGRTADAVVTVQPMTATDPDLTALAVIRLPVPSDERFLDPAVMRRALLDDSFARIGSTLDVDQMARELVDVVVPHFCNSAGVSVMESLIGADEMPVDALDSSQLLRRLAVGYRRQRRRLGGDVPDRRGAALPAGQPARAVPGQRRAGPGAHAFGRGGGEDRRGLAAQAGGRPAGRRCPCSSCR